jgi:hypothetical protein
VLRIKRHRTLNSQRVNGVTAQVIKAWFQRFLLLEIQAIKPEHWYNIDKSGITEGFGANG